MSVLLSRDGICRSALTRLEEEPSRYHMHASMSRDIFQGVIGSRFDCAVPSFYDFTGRVDDEDPCAASLRRDPFVIKRQFMLSGRC